MLEEALSFWNAIKGKVREAIREDTRNTVRMERYDVTTAPNGTKIGVSQPFGDEIFVPYSAEVANAQVGDTVLLVWWNSLSTAKAYYFGDGYNGGTVIAREVAYNSIDSVSEPGFYQVTGTPGLLIHEQWDASYATQIFQQYPGNGNVGTFQYRSKALGTWSAWNKFLDGAHAIQSSNSLWAGETYDLNSFFSGVVLCASDVQHVPSADWWHIMASGMSGTCVQIAAKLFNTSQMMTRRCASGTWSSWEPLYDNGYKVGDTFASISAMGIPGYVTSNGRQIWVYMDVDKSIEGITNISVTRLTGVCYASGGGLVDGGNQNWLTNSAYTITAGKSGNRRIYIGISKSTAFTNALNNAPVLFDAYVSLSFS